MIVVRLKTAMEAYSARTGERMTYRLLAERTDLSRATLESLASRRSYNTTLQTVEKLCRALGCSPGDLLELEEDLPE
jgi:putative transcriptional regulator